MKIGVFGGSFDPVHWGHILPILDAYHALQLDVVFFVPARQPPHKPHEPLHDPYHRVAMLACALSPYPRFLIETYELFQPPGSYTIDTLRYLQKRVPGEYFLFIGSDNLALLSTWKEPEKLISMAHLAVFSRPGYPIDQAIASLPRRLQEALKHTGNPLLFPHVEVSISATEIRAMAREARSLAGLVPSSVVSYIERHELYRE